MDQESREGPPETGLDKEDLRVLRDSPEGRRLVARLKDRLNSAMAQALTFCMPAQSGYRGDREASVYWKARCDELEDILVGELGVPI